MAEKTGGGGAESVSAGLQYHQIVPNTRMAQFHAIGQQVQRCAQWADRGGTASLLRYHFMCHHHRIVFPNHLPEITGHRQMVVQAAVAYQLSVFP